MYRVDGSMFYPEESIQASIIDYRFEDVDLCLQEIVQCQIQVKVNFLKCRSNYFLMNNNPFQRRNQGFLFLFVLTNRITEIIGNLWRD